MKIIFEPAANGVENPPVARQISSLPANRDASPIRRNSPIVQPPMSLDGPVFCERA
jgi:hypothetical protein